MATATITATVATTTLAATTLATASISAAALTTTTIASAALATALSAATLTATPITATTAARSVRSPARSVAGLSGMTSAQERRVERVRTAWEAGLEALGGVAPHIAAWRQIGWLGGLDSAAFSQLVATDVADAGSPVTFTDFINHYNRMLPKRAALFETSYELGHTLGQGGFGLVVKGTRTDNNEAYALKFAQKQQLNERAMKAVESEIRLWMRVQHEGVCRIFDAFDLSEQIVMVTELCHGGCLLDQIADVDGFSEADAQHISRQVSEAVVHLHRMGIAHRDIKPENVLCTDREPHRRGHVKLCDFGFAAEFVEYEGHPLSTFSQLIGTPEYMAPEMITALMKRRQGEEAQGYTFKVDYWALGCLIYELLVGEPPYFSDDDEEQYVLTLEAPFPLLEGVSDMAISLLKAHLDRDPIARLGMKTLEHEWVAAGCPGSPLKKERLSGDGTDPLASPLFNRKLVALRTLKVSPKPTSNLPPAALLLSPPLSPFIDRPTPPSVPHHRSQARRNKRIRVAQLAVIATSRFAVSGAFLVERNLRVSGYSHSNTATGMQMRTHTGDSPILDRPLTAHRSLARSRSPYRARPPYRLPRPRRARRCRASGQRGSRRLAKSRRCNLLAARADPVPLVPRPSLGALDSWLMDGRWARVMPNINFWMTGCSVLQSVYVRITCVSVVAVHVCLCLQ